MLKFTQKLHDAKKGFMSGSYRSIASEIMAEYGTDADGIAAEIMAVLNSDYSLADCKDNKELTTAFNSLQRAFRDTGEGLPDGIGGKLVYKFSTTGGKDNKSRTVACTYVTPAEIELAEKRATEDTAQKAERDSQDAEIAEDKARMELASLTALDVFNRVFAHAAETYPDHNMIDVVSAGLAWLQRDDTIADVVTENESATATG